MEILLERVREAVLSAGGSATNSQIVEYIKNKWPDTNPGSVQDQIQIASVNASSRVNYIQNQKEVPVPRDKYDFLYRTGRGNVTLYDQGVHGLWGITGVNGRYRIFRDYAPDPGIRYEEHFGVLYHTDRKWLEFLKNTDQKVMNFWSSRATDLRYVYDGMPFFFKTADQMISGFASYVRTERLTAHEAWNKYGEANGAGDMETFLSMYRKDSGEKSDTGAGLLSCLILRDPVFFSRPRAIYECGIATFQTMRYLDTLETSIITGLFSEFAPADLVYPAEARGAVRSQSVTETRPYQINLRKELRRLYNNECAICGIDLPEILRVSHIIPHSQCRGKYESAARRLDNSLLLCSLHDSLFDSGLITLTAEGGDYKIVQSQKLKALNKRIPGNRILDLPESLKFVPPVHKPSEASVEYHYNNIFLDRRRISHQN